MGLGAWDCQMCSFQSLCLCHCLCLCHRICHCHCHCISVTLPSLNSSCHELSENVWVWGCGTVRSAEFDLWAKCRGWWVGGRDKRTSWSDLVGVWQKHKKWVFLVKFTPLKKIHSCWECWGGANLTSVGQIEDSFGVSWYSWRLLKFPNEFHCPLGIWVCPDLVFEKKI